MAPPPVPASVTSGPSALSASSWQGNKVTAPRHPPPRPQRHFLSFSGSAHTLEAVGSSLRSHPTRAPQGRMGVPWPLSLLGEGPRTVPPRP